LLGAPGLVPAAGFTNPGGNGVKEKLSTMRKLALGSNLFMELLRLRERVPLVPR
jgi:hypothetical protein